MSPEVKARKQAELEKEKREKVHNVFDAAGMLPFIGWIFDATNGLIYWAEGDGEGVGLTAMAFLPVAGIISTPAKHEDDIAEVSVKYGSELAENVLRESDEIGRVVEGVSKAEGGSTSDSYLYQKYKESFVKDDVLNNSEEIIKGDKFGDKKLIAELTKDGRNVKDWSKMESIYSYTNEYGTGKIHYYKNVISGKISYYDAKMKISSPKLIRDRLINTVTDKDGFWIINLDENLIPIGVRK